MSDSTRLIRTRNVRVSNTFWSATDALEGKNPFLDLARTRSKRGGELSLSLPAGTRFVGYPIQEKNYLLFLRTLEAFLPATPRQGYNSWGEALFQTEAGAQWHIAFWYGARPRVEVRRMAWTEVPLKGIAPLVAPARPRVRGAELRYVAEDGTYCAVRRARNVLHIRRGSAGEKGRSASRRYAREWQAEQAEARLLAKLRKEGFRRSRS